MGEVIPVARKKTTREGLFFAMIVSLAAHSLFFSFEMRSSHTASSTFSSGPQPLFLSSSPKLSSTMGFSSPSNAQAQATRNTNTVTKEAPAKTSNLSDLIDFSTPNSANQHSSVATTELKTDETGSVLPSLLSEPIFPGGSPNRGQWGRKASPPSNQIHQSEDLGSAFVVPFLQSITTRLEPKASCEIKVSNSWTVARISCTDSEIHSLIAVYLSQQLQIMNSLPGKGYCFQISPGEFSTLACN